MTICETAWVADRELLQWVRSQVIPLRVVVKARYQRALYIGAGTQTMVLLAQDEPVGPVSVVVTTPQFDVTWLAPGLVTGETIHIGSHVIAFDHVRPCNTTLVSVEHWDPQALKQLVLKVWEYGDIWEHMGNATLRQRLKYVVHELLAALRGDNPGALRDAVESLIGLGEGSTPTGDDMLVGIIVGLSLACPRWAERVKNAIPSVTVLNARTTLPSALALSSVARGRVFSLVNETVGWLSAPNAENEDSVMRLANRGHTSGRDLLAGLVIGSKKHL